MSDQLRSIYARWQNLEADKAAISEDLKELFAEAKSNGYEPKALRIAFRLKAKAEGPEAAEAAETAALVETYIAALSYDAGVRLSRASAPARVEKIDEFGLGGVRSAVDASTPAPEAKAVPAPFQDDDDMRIPSFMVRSS